METSTMSLVNFAKVVVDMLRVDFPQAQIDIRPVTRGNGVTYTGLVINETATNVSPLIYLDPFFAKFQTKEMSLPEVVWDIKELYESHKQLTIDTAHLADWEFAKPKIEMELINRAKNEDLLKSVPHIDFYDLSIIFRVVLPSTDGNGKATYKVTNNLLSAFGAGVTTETLYETAKENSYLDAPVCKSMQETMAELMDIPVDAMPADMPMPEMWVLSNTSKVNGASTILYPNCLQDIAVRYNLKEFIIIPSSKHEVLILPTSNDTTPEDIKRMVKAVNSTEVSAEDYLSDNVYKYNRKADLITALF